MHVESFGWLLPLAALLAAGLFAGFCAGMFGIGGGFVVVPAMLLVLPLLGGAKTEYAHVAVGTSAATIIVASLGDSARQARRGRLRHPENLGAVADHRRRVRGRACRIRRWARAAADLRD